MAERYGGKYSPGTTGVGARQTRPARAGARVNLLFAAPFLILLGAFGKPPLGLALDIAGFGALMLAAWLTREGLRAEDAYDARKIASRPAIPRKLFGSAMTGLGLALAGLSHVTLSALEPALFFALGAGLHAVAFGPDPMRDKAPGGTSNLDRDRVARAVDQAEAHIAAMRSAIRKAGAPMLTRRVDEFTATVSRMVEAVEADPRDLVRARKYLSVYLLGARDATERFADIYARSQNAEARADYEVLLSDLEKGFHERTETMLLEDKSALDVEIEVLRDRLAQDGLRDKSRES